jgi:uncharacterized protein DUF1707
MTPPRRELRVGDRERDLVTSALQEALAAGRITLDELDTRLDRVLRARTFGDLDPLVADLMVEPPSTGLGQPEPRPGRPLAVASGASPDNRLVLNAGWSGLTRSGRWDLPPFLRLDAGKNRLRVDCLRATPLADVIDIQVVPSVGVVTILIPEPWAANTNQLGSSWGLARSKVSAKPEAGAPLLVLHGSVGWGRLTIRHPNRLDRRKLQQAAVPARPRRELER